MHGVQLLGGPLREFTHPQHALQYSVAVIRTYARFGSRRDPVFTLARQVVAGCRAMDQECQVSKLVDWVRSHVAYVPDPIGVDQHVMPHATLRARAGDCDDLTILVCSLLASIGVQPVLLLGTSGGGIQPTHVLPGAALADHIRPLEVSGTPDARSGLPPGFKVIEVVPV